MIKKVTVRTHEIGLWFRRGELRRVLQPGEHTMWSFAQVQVVLPVGVEHVDEAWQVANLIGDLFGVVAEVGAEELQQVRLPPRGREARGEARLAPAGHCSPENFCD